jgi:RNA polymerase sigma-70 factor (ECF subfamily)
LDADPDVARFEDLYRSNARVVLAYAMRRLPREDAEEILTATFLTAWRRRDNVPAAAALPWLLGVARNLISNQQRSERRRSALLSRLRLAMGRPSSPSSNPVDLRATVLQAMAALSDREREALMLAYWDDLDVTVAAHVAGCSPSTMTTRLYRARRHLASRRARTGVSGFTASDDGSPIGKPKGGQGYV